VIQPKEFQRNAIREAVGYFTRERGNQSACVLITAPTGSGKTLVAGRIAVEMAKREPTLWFWMAPFAGVVEQAAGALRDQCRELRVRSVQGDRYIDALMPGDVYVTTWASVASNKVDSRLARTSTEKLASIDDIIEVARSQGWRIGLVVDEAHHGFVTARVAKAFYRKVLRPDMTLLATATPDDADVESFRTAACLTAIARVTVSRSDAVQAGLLKDGIKAMSFIVPPESQQFRPDVAKATLRHAWNRHTDIRRILQEEGHSITPLMLVQVEDGADSAGGVRATLIGLGVPEERIAVHTADEPDPDVLAIARDPGKEVLIFKMAVALGFDAPRSWVLASLRRSADTDFGTQLVGRVLRVERRLQGLDVPGQLRYGYVYVADLNTQRGLAAAADKLGELKTAFVAPDSPGVQQSLIDDLHRQLEDAGVLNEHQIVHLGPDEVAPQPPAHQPSSPQGPGTISQPGSSGNQADLFGGFTLAPVPPSHPASPITLTQYPRRSDIDIEHLLVMRYPLDEDVAELVAGQVRIDDTAIAILQRQEAVLKRREVDLWAPSGSRVREDETSEEIDLIRIQQAGVQTLMGDSFIDGKDLLPLLERRLDDACRARGISYWRQTQDRLRAGILQILGTDPRILRNAVREALGKFAKSVPAARPLPVAMEWPEGLPLAPRNLYGVMPPGLSPSERAVADLLESEAYENVLWWHRNRSQDPTSAYLRIPGMDDRFFPDFVVAVRGRPTQGHILLIEPHGSHFIDNLQKIGSKHTSYGNVLVLAKDRGDVWYEQELGPDGKPEHGRRLRPDLLAGY
jgi:type III restriction enzyme